MTLGERLGRLAQAAAAVRDLGLVRPAADAEAVVERARARSGFAGDAYVLALAGGTGVGKSSLLNALAGRTVSAVRAVRPTTDAPLAWVAESRRGELAPLLAWLGVEHIATHADDALASVAILDLPDFDSVRTEHRARVEELLPRIDAVVWVVDPEKYDDERLHAYLRSLAVHAPRMHVVLNKADRVPEAQRAELVADLERRLVASGLERPRVHVTSASTGPGVDELRAALAAEAGTKALVTAKLMADAREALEQLARALAVEPGASHTPLLPAARRQAVTSEAVDGALAVIDVAGLSRQVQAAVMGRARRSGGSLLARVVTLMGWITGQQRRRADPAGFLRDWRRRGTLGRVVNPVRAGLLEAAGHLPAESRPMLLRALGADELEKASADALDAAGRDAVADLRIPGSLLWPVVGVAQLAVGAVFLFAVAWYVTLVVAGGGVPVSTFELPGLGAVPLPLLLLGGSVVVSAALGWLVALHAGWIGRRAARRVAARVRSAVEVAITDAGTAGLERVEAVRIDLGDALSAE